MNIQSASDASLPKLEDLLRRRTEALQERTRGASPEERQNAAQVCARAHLMASILISAAAQDAGDLMNSAVLAFAHADHCIILSGPMPESLAHVASLERQFARQIVEYNLRWDICRSLPAPNSNEAAEHGHPSPKTFSDLSFEEYISMHDQPWICLNWTQGWPIMALPDVPEYLASNFGHRLVPVEVGASYLDKDWAPKVLPLGQVLQLMRRGSPGSPLVYLAQYEIFDQIPQLRQLLWTPPFIDREECIVNIWLGPAGTRTPLHTDPYDNVLVQVCGGKTVYLVDPQYSLRILQEGEAGDSCGKNTSALTIEDFDAKEIPYLYADLGPGDSLHIPRGWWHLVLSKSESLSVSFWHLCDY